MKQRINRWDRENHMIKNNYMRTTGSLSSFRQKQHSNTSCSIGCLPLLIIVTNLLLGAVSFSYCLYNIFGKNVPWYADFIAGLFLGEITVPLMVIVWVIKLCGVEAPFIN